MLQLRKVQLLGFKSFCDRTDVALGGHGIAAIVGPNGCGKSNISDAITWVLGEQSAKSLRGLKMEDVIFAGTRDRRPTGMAEVSLTLVDPAVFQEETAPSTAISEIGSDWDEDLLRSEAAQETEEAVAEAQPGQTYEAGAVAPAPEPVSAATADPETKGAGPEVTLRVRRRKFGRNPIRAGEITVTRRLFRSGESEYLLNGKICRLRDIQDIFLGTGLGGDSYAIIGQERIGQLLSSRPLERRAIIEEAAGITRFKAKKRLAELRLESARSNLARVNDIFEEVTRQVAVLKRQAAKAERYSELRTGYVAKTRLVLRSRLLLMDIEQAAVRERLAVLGEEIERGAASVTELDAEHSAGLAKGYALEEELRETTARANTAGVELERAHARIAANRDRCAELETRLQGAEADLLTARGGLATLAAERNGHQQFVRSAVAEAGAQQAAVHEHQRQAAAANQQVQATEKEAETSRRQALAAMQRANSLRQEVAAAEAALAGLDREDSRLRSEAEAAAAELETLRTQRTAAQATVEAVAGRLRHLEADLAGLRTRMEQRRAAEAETRRAGHTLRSELATHVGRRSSLQALIREHSYSTDTVRNLFRSAVRPTAGGSSVGDLAPMGTLADFLEVDGQYEAAVEEFLRDELNFIVVRSWEAAREGLRRLADELGGRATFVIDIGGEPQPEQSFPERPDFAQNGSLIPLTGCVRLTGPFSRTLAQLLPHLAYSYLVADASAAQDLSFRHPESVFLSPSGEVFRNGTVTGGKPRAQGPLALKRELAAAQAHISTLETRLAEREQAAGELTGELSELTAAADALQGERRDGEREAANAAAGLRSVEGEIVRLERRAADAQTALKWNGEQRGGRGEHLNRKRAEADRLDAERAATEMQAAQLGDQLPALRAERERLQSAAATAAAVLAGLEERRRNAGANAERAEKQHATQAQRLAQIETTIAHARAELARRQEETGQLEAELTGLSTQRTEAQARAQALASEAATLRTRLTSLDASLRGMRHSLETLREQRGTQAAREARLSADLGHLETTCRQELSQDPDELRQDGSLSLLEGEALHAEAAAAQALRKKMEALGPVNMMALEELRESTERHSFLTEQRSDLLTSIENTAASIREIDDVSRVKFNEAFGIINENFGNTFTKLFGGGQAFMRLTETEGNGDKDSAGIEIIASPPGKKLQNILLLSGGEKALTALALLVGTFQFQPAPFCVLDEVDAPLDETNIGRFARLISEMSGHTQFVVITHSKRTMEQADIMYGVTMQEPGVSKIVSVSLGGRDRGKEARSAA